MKMFAVVNNTERVRFEKEHQMPYGYGNCLVFQKLENAVKYFKRLPNYIKKNFVVESYESGIREVIYE